MVTPEPAASTAAEQRTAAAAPLERSVLRSLSKTSLGFEALYVAFNPLDEQQLLVSGYKNCA